LAYGIVFGDGEEEEKEIFWVAGDSSAVYAESTAAVFAAYIAITRPLSVGIWGPLWDSPYPHGHPRFFTLVGARRHFFDLRDCLW
jgi:hypothetical protein